MRFAALGVFVLTALSACGSEAARVPAPGVPADEPAVESPASEAPSTAPPKKPGTSKPQSEDGAPYPVVLLHGMAGGFDHLEVGPLEVDYFSGIVDELAAHGEEAWVTFAPPYDTSEVRAAAITEQIDEILLATGKAKVNLVGHSQGGLDARILASPNGLGYESKIASVTTIATPHYGTRIADAALGFIGFIPKRTLDGIIGGLVGLVQRSAYDLEVDSNLRGQVEVLSEKYMRDVFNPTYIDSPTVFYSSYAGRTNRQNGSVLCDNAVHPNEPTKLDTVTPALKPTAVYLEESEGQISDGLVPVASAVWGTFEQCVPADHMKEAGLLGDASPFDHKGFFRVIVERLRAHGL